MELNEENIPEEQQEDAVEIYSKNAVFWFSVLTYPLFGGALLALNLKAAGYKRAVYTVLIFSVSFYFITYFLLAELANIYKIDLDAYQQKLVNYKAGADIFDAKVFLFITASIVLNIIGGLILTRYFFKKYFPDDDYYPKSIAAPLFIAILIMLLLPYIGARF